MKKTHLFVCGGVVALAVAMYSALPLAQQRPAPSPDRAQDQPFPPGSPFALLPGFKIERVTPVDKTESYIVVTFDSLGRPVVSQSSSGNGVAPRVLLDNDKDGIFESEKIIAPQLNTCHGLFFEGRTLYADCRAALAGDPPAAEGGRGGGGGGAAAQAQAPPGAPAAAPAAPAPPTGIAGLYKLQDTNGDDVMDTIERIQRYTGAGMGDHGSHAVRRGPDGSVMFLVGNNTYVGAPPVNDDVVDKAASPNWNNLKERQFVPQNNDPRFGNSTRIGVHATVWRLQPDNKYSLQYSGMRNPYDFAYNIAGEGFTFDSDMEWDVNAPWYREVRTVHLIPGGDSGYRNGTGKFQDEYFDTLPALRHLRRGSPVGVETYQSYAYPARFFDNLFEADWSRGRLLYTALTPAGGSYRGREDLAEFVHGEPMPIADLEVGPDGNIYLVTGGGAGQGGMYKVSWTGARPAQPDMTGILGVVRQPQPLSSFGWAAIEAARTSMGASFATSLEALARNVSAASMDRARAILEMQRHGAAPSAALLQALVTDKDANVRAAVVYAAGVQTSAGAKAVAAAALKDSNQLVKRRAAEALVRQGLRADQPSFAPVADIYALLRDPDLWVRYSGRLALEHTPRAEWSKLVMAETNVVALTEGLLALTNTAPAETELRPIFDKLITLMRRTTLPASEKIRVLRAFQVGATETRAGVDPEIRKQVHDALINQMPAAPPSASFAECANRTATTGCPETLLAHHLAKVLAYTGEPDVVSKILAVMPTGDNDQPGQIDYANSLRMIDRGWTPAEKKQVTAWYAKASRWRGGSTFAGHINIIFDATMDAFTDAEKLEVYKAVPLFAPLTPEEIAAAAAGGGGRGGGGGGRGNAAPAAGAPPAGAPPAGAPPAGPPPAGPPAAGVPPAGAPPAGALPAGAPAGGAPGAAPGRGGGGGGGGRAGAPALSRNVPLALEERYDNLVFPRGGGPGSLTGRGGGPNVANGEKMFQQACASCHKFGTVGAAYAPELTGIGKSMLRRDILRSIFFPSEKVDAKYESTVITTKDKQTIRGLVLSETAQNVVLKTTADAQPVTVVKTNIATRVKERTSIMPSDLPDRVGDGNIRDITVYLMGSGG